MNRRTIMLFGIAIFAAITTIIALRGWVEGQRADFAAQAERNGGTPGMMEVVVAEGNLPAGLLVKRGHLRWQSWPEDAIRKNYAVRGRVQLEDLVGSVVRSGIAEGEPVTEGRIVKPGERGFLSVVLTPGKRAMSVPVNATTGISGFVFPGDRVDLILTHGIDSQGEGKRARKASETVLTNVRVLGVDQETDDQTGKAAVATTVTLELTAKEAEIVSLVIDLGRLSLSLRSLATAEDGDTGGHSLTWDSEVSHLLGGPSAALSGRNIQVVKGSETFVVGF